MFYLALEIPNVAGTPRRSFEAKGWPFSLFNSMSLTRRALIAPRRGSLLHQSKAGRIVNLSSGLGSLSQTADPNGPFRDRNMLVAYCSSKSALNMMTLHFAHELKNDGIKVNAANPGYTATDMNQHRGVKTVEHGAATPVRLALLPDDGPTGGCFSDEGPAPW